MSPELTQVAAKPSHGNSLLVFSASIYLATFELVQTKTIATARVSWPSAFTRVSCLSIYIFMQRSCLFLLHGRTFVLFSGTIWKGFAKNFKCYHIFRNCLRELFFSEFSFFRQKLSFLSTFRFFHFDFFLSSAEFRISFHVGQNFQQTIDLSSFRLLEYKFQMIDSTNCPFQTSEKSNWWFGQIPLS